MLFSPPQTRVEGTNRLSMAPVSKTHTPCKFSLLFQSSPLAVRHALGEMMEHIRAQSISEKSIGLFELVLAEALNNVVEHAYEGHETGDISLSVVIWNGSLICNIKDSGKPMPKLSLPIPTQKDLNVSLEGLPEGGWGWMMIRELSDSITYKRKRDQNHLSFRLLV